MRWFKIAAIGVGILIAFLVVGSVIGAILHAVIDVVIAAAVVGAIVVAVKVARARNQVSAKKADREVREPDHREYNMPLPRADVEPVRDEPVRGPSKLDVDDDLARLKREMGSLASLTCLWDPQLPRRYGAVDPVPVAEWHGRADGIRRQVPPRVPYAGDGRESS